MDRLKKIRGRQQARFIKHLKNTKQHTAALEKDVVRSFGFFEQDVEMMIAESRACGELPQAETITADEDKQPSTANGRWCGEVRR